MNPFQPTQYFHRDSRQAFGHRFQVERPSRDWLWMVGAVVLVAAFAVGYWTV